MGSNLNNLGAFCKSTQLTCIVLIASLLTPHFNCHKHDADCHEQRRPTSGQLRARQQRQFNQRGQSSAGANQAAPSQAGLPQPSYRQRVQAERLVKSAEMEHEEFSLALGGASSQQLQEQQANSNYTLLPPLEANEQANNQTEEIAASHLVPEVSVSNTTPSIPNEPIGSPVALQPPLTTTSSIPTTASKLTATPTSTVATTTTTTTEARSSQNATGTPSFSQQTSLDTARESGAQKQPQGRRIEESSLEPARERQFSTDGQVLARNEELYQTNQAFSSANNRHQLTGQSHPVSASPSSISIITPLIGPPNQQQQQQQQQIHTTSVGAAIGTSDGMQPNRVDSQQSAMMKPIFVVGNPISERDYNQEHQFHSKETQSQQSAPTAEGGQYLNTRPLAVPMQEEGQSANGANPMQRATSSKSLEAAAYPMIQQPVPAQQEQHAPVLASRSEKIADDSSFKTGTQNTTTSASNFQLGERMSGPALVYSDGHLASVPSSDSSVQVSQAGNSSASHQAASPRLLQAAGGAAVVGNNPRKPSLPPPVNQANAASGFRSPASPSGSLIGQPPLPLTQLQPQMQPQMQPPANSVPQNSASFYQTSPPYAGGNMIPSANGFTNMALQPSMGYNKQAFLLSQPNQVAGQQLQQQPMVQPQVPTPAPGSAPGSGYSGRRPLNITRVERK